MSLRVPAFKAHLRLVPIPGEGVLAMSADETHALQGRLYAHVVPLIDGRRRVADIVAALAGVLDPARVHYALLRLERRGLIAESAPEVPAAVAAFWHGQDVDPAAAQAALAEARVRVTAVDAGVNADAGAGTAQDAATLREALARLGIATADTTDAGAAERASAASPIACHVVVTDDYLADGLAEIDRAARAAGQPWMLLRPRAAEAWIGPLFMPGETGCLHCLWHKLVRHTPVRRFASHHAGAPVAPPTAGLPGASRAACDLAAVEVAKVLAGAAPGLRGQVLSLDTRTWATATHRLIRNPTCPACGTPAPREARAITPRPAAARFNSDGGHRTVSAEATLNAHGHLISPITGAVSGIHLVGRRDGVAHVAVSGHNHVFAIRHLEHLKHGLRSGNAGKGASESQARASALAEALERYSSEADGSEIKVAGSFRDMRAAHGAAVVHPNTVMRFSERQYAERAAWNAKRSRFNVVPAPLDADTVIDWTPVWSLTRERHVHLATQLLYHGARAGPDTDETHAIGCSNGNAAGNTLEEAILQGFLELVERDATAIWWYNRLRRPAVDVAAFGDPWVDALLEHHRAQGRACWALDITSDLGIPAIVAISARADGGDEQMLFGLGCHLDARIAVQRAFAEMNQMLAMADPDGTIAIEALDAETANWLRVATRAAQPHMTPDPAAAPRRPADFPARASGDLRTDILTCQGIVEAKGLELLVLDHTRPDVGLPVVKVVVPGLRHFWARFGAGRLYDVPVAMGWLPAPLSEDALNPIAMFL